MDYTLTKTFSKETISATGALYKAIKQKNLNTVKKAIEDGAEINNNYGYALRLAKKECAEIAELLIKHGAKDLLG